MIGKTQLLCVMHIFSQFIKPSLVHANLPTLGGPPKVPQVVRGIVLHVQQQSSPQFNQGTMLGRHVIHC